MARKKNILACPACQARLLQDCAQCTGLLITCPQCGASVLADIEDSGRMRLSVEPHDKVQQPNTPPPMYK